MVGSARVSELLRPSVLWWSTNQEPTVGCRIEHVVSDGHLVVLSISGRITDEWVDLLRKVIDQEAAPPAIDLGSVVLVDREAVKLLAQIEHDGTELRNCPAYVHEWISKERALGRRT